MAERSYESQVIRFGNRGLNLALPPELVPNDQYVVLNNVVTNREGTLQSAAGGIALFTSAGNTHSIRRFEKHIDGTTFYIVGFDNEIQLAVAGGGFYLAVIVAGIGVNPAFSGDPMTFVAYKAGGHSEPYMFIGDRLLNVKIKWDGTATRIGIVRPLPVFGQVGLVPVASGAGNLTGDYDWRYTYARLVGGVVAAESNPSDIGTTISLTDESADLTLHEPNALQGDITHARLWRRGGTLPDAWRLVATIAIADFTGTPATYTHTDDMADADIASATTLALDNDLLGTSVTSGGSTLADLNAVPMPYLWGALEETLFATGDRNRPDVVYYSKQGQPEAWPAENTISLDSPQDEAVNGFIYGGKSFVWTQEALWALIPNILTGRIWTPVKTPCGRGVVGPFAFCVGPKVWFCSKDGIYEWSGQGEAVRINDPIRSIFPFNTQAGYTQNTNVPVNFGFGIQVLTNIRMMYHNNEVWFHYNAVDGVRRTLVYSTETQAWRNINMAAFSFSYADEAPQSNLLLIRTSGHVIQSQGGSLLWQPVTSIARMGGHDQGFPRADKEYGDGAVWADCAGGSISVTVYVNSDFPNPVFTAVLTGSGLQRYILPLAGLYGRHISYEFAWSTTDESMPVLYWIEASYLPHPEEIITRKTDWDDLDYPADKLIKGVLLTADTQGQPVTLQVLYDGDNVGATFTIGPTTAGRPQVFNVGWPSFRARKIRIEPTSATEWKFYGVNRWLFDPEPESIGFHEVYWGDGGHTHDKLVKGLTVEADCRGVARTLQVYDDANVLRHTFIIGPGVDGIPTMYESGFAAFRTRNMRIIEAAPSADWKLVRVAWLYDPEPMDIVHWETQESALGFDGFHFDRDAYVELRSTAITALTVEVDGVAQTAYAIASTAGGRRRVYVPFRANKGKLYRYLFDAAEGFHLYDFSLRAHTWRGEAPYRQVNPLTGTEGPWRTDAVRGPDARQI